MRMLVGVVAAGVLLAGCSGSGGASPSPSVTPATAATTSRAATPSPTRTGPLTTGPGVRPGEEPPVEFPAMRADDSAGALAAAFYFMRALDWSLATGDTSLISQVSDRSCVACRKHIRDVRSLFDSGGYVRGGRIRVESAKLVTGRFSVKSDLVVKVRVTQAPIILVRRTGSSSTPAPHAVTSDSLLFLTWRSRWIVIEQGDS